MDVKWVDRTRTAVIETADGNSTFAGNEILCIRKWNILTSHDIA